MTSAANRSPAPRRSPRQIQESAQNRAAIILSARDLFATHGYTNTTLHAIADRVGLTRQGLLHHFGSKEGLFLEVIEVERSWAARQLYRRTPERGLRGLRAMSTFVGRLEEIVHLKFLFTVQGEAVHDDAPDYVTAFAGTRLARIREQVSARLAEAHEDGEVDVGEIATLATLITGAIAGLQAEWLMDSTVPTVAAFELLMELLPAASQQAVRDAVRAADRDAGPGAPVRTNTD